MALGLLQHLDKMQALVLPVEERLEHQPLGQTITQEASLGTHRLNQEDCLVQVHLANQPPPPQALALGLEHQLELPTACLGLPALVEVSFLPRIMPLLRINRLGLETLEQVPAVEVSLEPLTLPPTLLGVHLALSLGQLALLLLQLGLPLNLIHQPAQILW